MCLKCNNAPHFPAKCSQISNYYKELKLNYDLSFGEEPEIYRSEGRRCPHCNLFVEKIGGCNHMHCTFCTKNFCWGCGKSEGHFTCSKLNKSTMTIVEFKNEKPTSNKQKFQPYNRALLHRRKRTQAEMRMLKKQANRLLASIKLSEIELDQNELNEECKRFYSQIELIVHENSLKTEKKNKIKQFLNELISFIRELHFVCEHAHILLSDAHLDTEKRSSISSVIKGLEVVAWLLENYLENNCKNDGGGFEIVKKLKEYHSRGLNCLKRLKKLNVE
jgi:hypothetical protein